jgi:hypothetical protein
MKNLKISYYERQADIRPTSVVTIPLSVLEIAAKLMPVEVKKVLETEGIDILGCKELVKVKDLKGPIIEIENQGAKLIIAVE